MSTLISTAATVEFSFDPYQGHRLAVTTPGCDEPGGAWARAASLELAVDHTSMMVAGLAVRPEGGDWVAGSWCWYDGAKMPPLPAGDPRIFPEQVVTLVLLHPFPGGPALERRFRVGRQLAYQLNRSAIRSQDANFKQQWYDMLVEGVRSRTPGQVAATATYRGVVHSID